MMSASPANRGPRTNAGHLLAGIGVSCMLVLVVACGANEAGPAAEATVVTAEMLSDGVALDPVAVQNIGGNASEFEKALIADGKLSLAEYQQAVFAEAKCLRDAGLTVIGDDMLTSLYQYQLHVGIPASIGRAGLEISQRCHTEHTGVIGMFWAGITASFAEKVIPETRKAMKDCLATSGYSAADQPADSTDPAVAAAYKACLDSVDSAYRLGGISFGIEGDEAYPRPQPTPG